MADYGVFSPQDARMILDAVRWLKASGMMTQSGRKSPGTFIPETPAYAKNVSGETIPAYACVQCVGTLELGGQNYIEIDQPADDDGTAGPFLFNGHNEIQPDEFGKLDDSMEIRAICGSSDAGTSVSPTSGSWDLSEVDDGMFSVIGSDAIASGISRVIRKLSNC